MSSGLFFRLFLKLYRKEILREAYVGVLGREPDAVGLAAHAAHIEQKGQLAPVLAEMSQSTEAWEIALKGRAEAIVHQLHDALREGDTHPDDFATWTAQLRATSDLGAVTGSMTQGAAHWREMARRDPDALINAAFVALLERQPDLDGLTHYTNLLRDTGDIALFLSSVCGSIEHQTRVLERSGALLSVQTTPVTMSSFSHEALVNAAFRGLLGREPDPEALLAYTTSLQETGDVAGFLAEVGQSAEHRKRVLLKRN